VWSYDFVEDRTHDGRKYRMFNVVDEFTHEAWRSEFGASSTRQMSLMFYATCSSRVAFPGTSVQTMAPSSSLRR